MNVLKEYKKGDWNHVDTGITKEEWLNILHDPALSDNQKDALFKFYYEPDHKAPCAKLSGSYPPQTASSFNGLIKGLGQFVQKKLGRFKILDGQDHESFYTIIMDGRNLKTKQGIFYEWRVKEEVIEAIQTYLYQVLIEKYKELRRKIQLDDQDSNELYKWELITECNNKSLIEIADRIRTTNLVYTTLANGTIDWLIKYKQDQFKNALESLVVKTIDLNDRIKAYNSTMKLLCPDDQFKSYKAEDERTISTILGCYDPQNYTFYKSEVYSKLCDYLGLDKKERKRSKERFAHFLQLLRPLAEMIDQELLDIVSPSLNNVEHSNLLLAQDMCWMLLIKYPNLLPYPPQKSAKMNYWLVGYTIGGESQLDSFYDNNEWRAKFRIDEDSDQLEQAKSINKGDILIFKSTFTKGNNHEISSLRIKSVAVVESDMQALDEVSDYEGLRYKVKFISKEQKDFDGSSFGAFRKTIHLCDNKEIIEYVNSLFPEHMEDIKKYKYYTDLLEANHNLILTGAPGTGKTHLAREIAKNMLGLESIKDLEKDKRFGFVQFHPSYDYTDFVEGLRPIKGQEGQVGFERKNGVFKDFCIEAAKNFEDSKKNKQELIEEKTLEEKYNELVDKIENDEITDFPLKTEGKKMEIVKVSDFNNIILRTPGTSSIRTYTVSFSRLAKLAKVFPDLKSLNSISNINDAFRDVIGGCHASCYWTVLNEVYKQGSSKLKDSDVEVHEENFVFIIDEINRGEISKIFGELFFSIDPGYRGKEGIVNTQYQNMIEDGDPFKDGFYVPKNVYIIGTMNDIDRSVESMDFAMRRRFAWEEVKAEESFDNIIKDSDDFTPDKKDNIKLRMTNLNKAIADEKLGLGESYQIGAAYFMKLKNYNGDFQKLWNYHLKGLLFEYLRGNRNVKEQMEKLEAAYNCKESHESSDNNIG